MPDETPASRARLAAAVTAAFVLATLPRLLAHELWRDEAWLWLVATGSGSPAELFAPLGRSGQGYLFSLLCYAVAQLWESPRALQLLHLAIAGGATYVFVRWAPFGRAARVLFACGYFPFYEYAVISRHYALGALLLWLACLAATRRGAAAAIGLGAALGLLCQTTVYGFLLAVAVAAGWLARRAGEEGLPRPGPAGVAGVALALAGAVAGLVQMVPAPGTSFAPGWLFGWDAARAAKALAAPWRAAVPLPLPRVQFWSSNLLDPWPALQAAGGLAVLALAVAVLWPRRRTALVVFALGGAGLLAFTYVKFAGTTRHHGHWWLLAAAALWLAGGLPRAPGRAWRRAAIHALLAVHCAVALFASLVDLRHPFSNAAATADLLRRSGLDRLPLLGWREPPAAPVALALGAPLYAPSRGVYTTHPDWGPIQRELTRREVRCIARRLAAREGSDVVLVVNRRELPPWPEIEAAGSRRGAITPSEDYHLYRLRRDLLAATAARARCAGEGVSAPRPRRPGAAAGAPAPPPPPRGGRGRSSAGRRGRG